MHIVNCSYCNKNFDIDKLPYVKVDNMYLHKECFEREPRKVDFRVCKYCKQPFDIYREGYRKVGRRYAHISCYDSNFSADSEYLEEIYNYLRYDLKIDVDFPALCAQAERYVKNNGYTYEGIYKTLRYYYGLENGDPSKSMGRIGIVPFVYDKAMDYYKRIEDYQEEVRQVVEEQIEKEDTVVITKAEERKPKDYISLDF